MTPENCPNCGADVPAKAKACPECGACEETGWSEDAEAEAQAKAAGIPTDDFDYEEFVQRELEGKAPKRKFGAVWMITAIALLAVFLWAMFGRRS